MILLSFLRGSGVQSCIITIFLFDSRYTCCHVPFLNGWLLPTQFGCCGVRALKLFHGALVLAVDHLFVVLYQGQFLPDGLDAEARVKLLLVSGREQSCVALKVILVWSNNTTLSDWVLVDVGGPCDFFNHVADGAPIQRRRSLRLVIQIRLARLGVYDLLFGAWLLRCLLLGTTWLRVVIGSHHRLFLRHLFLLLLRRNGSLYGSLDSFLISSSR